MSSKSTQSAHLGSSADLIRLAEWLEEVADRTTSALELGTADEGVLLKHQGEGSLLAELRGELRPWHWDEPAGVVQFKLQVELEELRRGAHDLRAEVEAWGGAALRSGSRSAQSVRRY